MQRVRIFLADEHGANVAEYGLLLGFVAAATIAGGAILQSGMTSFLEHAADFLDQQSFPNN